MGIDAGKLVGQNSGVTAADLAKKADLGELPVGKLTQAQLQGGQSGKTGSPWADQGAHCDDSYADGCFLNDRRRDHLITDIKLRVITAATNYKLALEQMRVAELLKKEDDLPWVLSLALDVATGFLMSKVTKALTKIRTAGAERVLNNTFTSDGEAIEHARIDKILSSLSDKQVEKWTKSAFDAAGKQVKSTFKKARGADDQSDKTEALSYIAQLTKASDKSFETFANNAATTANDGELSVLYEGLDPDNHSVDAYKAALDAKLKRYMKSGVTDIERKIGKDRATGYADVKRDTRVVWVQDDSFGRMLWYQEQEADHDPSTIQPGDPGSDVLPIEQPDKLTFGTKTPRNDAKLTKRVPDEFIEAAIARSEATWGPTPVIDSPMRQNYLKQVGSSTMTPAPATPAAVPPIVAGATSGAGGGAGGGALPAGSVFARKKPADADPVGPVVPQPPNFMSGDQKDQKP